MHEQPLIVSRASSSTLSGMPSCCVQSQMISPKVFEHFGNVADPNSAI
jgi:hypothetical protein